MKKKSLIETNPYLKDPVMRKALVARSVATSGGVEGIKASKSRVPLAAPDIAQKILLK